METNKRHDDLETRLLLRAAKGDAEAFAQLHAAVHSPIRDYVASLDGHLGCHEIDDITQEVFLRAWQKAKAFAARSSARTYLMGIARRVFQESLRRRRKAPLRLLCENDVPAPLPMGLYIGDASHIRQVVGQAKSGLSEEQREAFELVCVLGLSIAETARLCRCSTTQLRSRLWRARLRLRKALGSLPEATLP